MCFRVIGLGLKCSIKIGNCLLVLTLLGQGKSQIVVGSRGKGIKSQDIFKMLYCLSVFPVTGQYRSQVIVMFKKIRFDSECFRKMVYRTLQIPFMNKGVCEVIMCQIIIRGNINGVPKKGKAVRPVVNLNPRA